MTFAFDAHLHFLPLKYVCASSYFAFVKQNALEESYAALFAPDYIYTGLFTNKNIIQNLLAVAENDIEHIACLYEDDLRGKFGQGPRHSVPHRVPRTMPDVLPQLLPKAPLQVVPGSHRKNAVLFNSGFASAKGLKEQEQNIHCDKLVLMPLIIDFSSHIQANDIYYNRAVPHDFYADIADTIEGIRRFRVSRPESPCIIRPYLGINLAMHTIAELDALLNTHFLRKKGWSPKANAYMRTWKNLKSAKPVTSFERIPQNMFAGIKVYPPLGFDPGTSEKKQKEKNDFLFAFCEKNTVPIVTHCDDQGFRMIPQEKSLKFTSPKRWENVLKTYPELFLDFAHFGKQYYKGLRFKQDFQWRDKIISFLREYPNVYADVAFNGNAKNEWEDFSALFLNPDSSVVRDEMDALALSEKLMFGTDWPLILWRTESALGYWQDFLHSPVPDIVKHRMISENPASFAFR